MKTVEQQVQAFKSVRDAHAQEVIEDYVELIADLIETEGEARSVDLSKRLGVTAATVNNTLKRLERDGYVTTQPYRSIFLTDQGRDLAERCRSRHRLVRDFLIAVGVDEATAEQDAEGIEHHVSQATLEVFARVVDAGGLKPKN